MGLYHCGYHVLIHFGIFTILIYGCSDGGLLPCV